MNLLSKMLNCIDWFISKPDLSRKDKQQSRVVVSFALAAMVWTLVYAYMHYVIQQQPILGHLAILSFFFSVIVLAIVKFGHSHILAANLFILFYLITISLSALFKGGFFASILIWGTVLPLVSVMMVGRAAGLIWTLILFLQNITFFLLAQYHIKLPMLVADNEITPLHLLALLGAQTFGLSVSFWYETIHEQTNEQLTQEQDHLKEQINSQEIERQMIAYDIHDDLVQYMTGSLMQLEAGIQKVPKTEELDTGLFLLRNSLTSARRLMNGLRPFTLDELGVVAAIESLLEDLDEYKVDYECDVKFKRLSAVSEVALFRICQESLNNIVKHSNASEVTVKLKQRDDQLTMSIADNGTGFDTEKAVKDTFGLRGIHQRARYLNGSVEIINESGTKIIVTVPIIEESTGS